DRKLSCFVLLSRGGKLTAFYLGVFALSLGLSFVFTWRVRNFAVTYGWRAPPTVDRHLHKTPLPRLGGVAILSSFLVTIGIAAVIGSRFHNNEFGFPARTWLTLLLPCCLVFLLGLYDDICNAGPYLKFSVQALAATMLFVGGLRILDVPVLFGA